MKLTMLGTGHAMVTNCYNTCFLLSDENGTFLVDTGGGNGILKQLKAANVSYRDLSAIFITHKHIDHLLGIYWLLRQYSVGKDDYFVTLYSHTEVIELIQRQMQELFNEKQLERICRRVRFETIQHNETVSIIGHPVTFFDTHSTEVTQYGFVMELSEGKHLCCLGDVPYNESEREYAYQAEWLMHEAFTVSEEYRGYHATVRTAAQNAEDLKAKNLIIYHTEDSNLSHRKEIYGSRAQSYYHGNIFLPSDLESIELI